MQRITNGVKILLFANILVLILGYVIQQIQGVSLSHMLGLHYYKSTYFKPLQLVTYMFVHAGFMHIFFNMFALVQFGSMIETVWGTKRFSFYYLVTGVGAGIVHMIVTHLQLAPMYEALDAFHASPTPDTLMAVIQSNSVFGDPRFMEIVNSWQTGFYTDEKVIKSIEPFLTSGATAVCNVPVVGASGAVFGILLAFGLMFPNLKLQFLFIPIGIPAKYFVLIYGVLELFFGINDFNGDNVAHFAHLGGMLVGFILLMIWSRRTRGDYE